MLRDLDVLSSFQMIHSPYCSEYICELCECKLQSFSKFRNDIQAKQKVLAHYLCRNKDFRNEQLYNDPLKVELETDNDELLEEIEPEVYYPEDSKNIQNESLNKPRR